MQIAPGDSGEHTYTEIVDSSRAYGAAAREDIEELWRRVAFSILITNIDDHLHHHGFLHVEHESWRLAPAYDVNSFPDKIRELETGISEDTGPAASVESVMSVAPYFSMTLQRARRILREVESAVATWRHVGAQLNMTPFELDQFADAFEHEERTAAHSLLATRRHPPTRTARKRR